MKPSEPAASPLPPDLESLIARTVKRARLRASERDDVTRELRSHFVEAIADGTPTDDVVGGFGDPDAAGRLIGRAKRRCRGLAWHAWVWSCRGVGALFALVLITYAWAAWAYYGAEPTITRNYVKEMNDRIEAIPEDDRAWPLYKRALLSIPQADVDRMWKLHFYDSEDGVAEWREFRELLEKHRAAIDLILEASDRPAMAYPIATEPEEDVRRWREWPDRPMQAWKGDAKNPPLMGLEHGLSQLSRSLALLLRSEAQRALEDGDAARWEEALIGGFRLIRQLNQRESMLNYLVTMTISPMLIASVGKGIALHPETITKEALVRLAHEMKAEEQRMHSIPFEADRIEIEDLVQRLYSNRTGRITSAGIESMAAYFDERAKYSDIYGMILQPPKWAGPLMGAVVATKEEVLKEADRTIDACVAWAAIPMHERPAHPRFEWQDGRARGRTGEIRWWPIDSAFTSAHGTARIRDISIIRSAGVRVAIAIELFRRARGHLPTELAQLVPEFLPEIPTDRYSGEALRFIAKDGVPIVYSVGCDMDDDQARVPPKSYGRFALSPASWGPPRTTDPDWWTEERIREHDGDWILWPPINPDTGAFNVTPRAEASP